MWSFRKEELPGAEGCPPPSAIFYQEISVSELSLFVNESLHDAIEYALASNAVMYKDGSPKDYRLAQAADLICALELTALKFEANEHNKTDDRFFGAFGNFKKNYLKKIRKMLL